MFVAANSPGTAIARCHLIANTLGGKGQILDGGQANLVPCWQVGMNTGTPSMRTYEALVKNWVTFLSSNDAVYYEVTPNYKDSTSTIPDGVTMSATLELDNGFQYPLFQNVFIPNTQASSGLNLGN
ncbi:MAG: DNA/RNA non-specific endonuclease [Streptomyces sp.]|nr:DNA/RNA non-specific endonuclease [Streptomyces sp.]